MTDYNDGKWHGWNGGECPVDLGCLVEFQTICGVDRRADHDPCAAGDLSWLHDGDDGDLIAFRVTKPDPPKPREWWITTWDNIPKPREWWITTWDNIAHDSEADAIDHNAGFDMLAGKTIHVREVLP